MPRWMLPGSLLLLALLSSCGRNPSPPAASLHDAIVLRNASAIQAHLDAGTDVNAANEYGVTPLIAAATSGQPDVVRALIAAGADVNGRGPDRATALIDAIRAEQPEMVALLLEQRGVDVEARDENGSTPLVEAIALDQMDVATALLEHGAAISGPGPHGRTALHHAALSLDPERIAWLLDRGASGNATDEIGALPLHMAAMFPDGYDEWDDRDVRGALQLILIVTDDVNARDRHGRTPLHYAAAWAHPWVIDMLIQADADPTATDQLGATPVAMIATEHARPRDADETRAVVERFRASGLTDDSLIDAKGTTFAQVEAWARELR